MCLKVHLFFTFPPVDSSNFIHLFYINMQLYSTSPRNCFFLLLLFMLLMVQHAAQSSILFLMFKIRIYYRTKFIVNLKLTLCHFEELCILQECMVLLSCLYSMFDNNESSFWSIVSFTITPLEDGSHDPGASYLRIKVSVRCESLNVDPLFHISPLLFFSLDSLFLWLCARLTHITD